MSILSRCLLGYVEVASVWVFGNVVPLGSIALAVFSSLRKAYISRGRRCLIVLSTCNIIYFVKFIFRKQLEQIVHLSSIFPDIAILQPTYWHSNISHTSCRPRYTIHHRIRAEARRDRVIVAHQYLCIQDLVSVSSKQSRGTSFTAGTHLPLCQRSLLLQHLLLLCLSHTNPDMQHATQ